MAEGKKLDISDVIANFIITKPYGTKGGYPNETIVFGTDIIRYSKGTEIIPERFQRVYRNKSNNNHAEKQFIEALGAEIKELQQSEDSVKEIIVNLVQNYSPCPSCVEKIIAFMKTNNIQSSWTIKFANFYKIYYNRENGELKNSEDCILGLVKLRKNGVKLDLFRGEKDWEKFFDEYVDPNARTKGLQEAISNERKKREDDDEKIFAYINTLASAGEEGANTEEDGGELEEDGGQSEEDGGQSEEDGGQSEKMAKMMQKLKTK